MQLYIVTGSSRGLGLAIVQQLAARPDVEVIAFARTAQTMEGVRTLQMDLAQPESIGPAVLGAVRECSRPRYEKAVLINNAGIVAPVGPLARNSAAAMDTNIRVNLTAPLIMMQAFIEATSGLASDRLIINISSGAGKRPVSGWSTYCASKAGLDMATRVVALEDVPGLKVCSLAPGVIDTPMQAELRKAKVEDFPDIARFQAMMAEGTLRPPQDVAADILRVMDSGRLQHGGLQDIRELAQAN